ncbi:hypothetical protein BaRGS_00019008 [Batillaria attramentaria]|uniref:Secreted protein n=1 Tax=Batillaria attramentaria TaxID=370345 RepID=A0ABD0KRP3_9CAEN
MLLAGLRPTVTVRCVTSVLPICLSGVTARDSPCPGQRAVTRIIAPSAAIAPSHCSSDYPGNRSSFQPFFLFLPLLSTTAHTIISRTCESNNCRDVRIDADDPISQTSGDHRLKRLQCTYEYGSGINNLLWMRSTGGELHHSDTGGTKVIVERRATPPDTETVTRLCEKRSAPSRESGKPTSVGVRLRDEKRTSYYSLTGVPRNPQPFSSNTWRHVTSLHTNVYPSNAPQ